ncbi:MAG: hypothetical protein ACP5JE_04730, partial [Thermoplasmata archaeon]
IYSNGFLYVLTSGQIFYILQLTNNLYLYNSINLWATYTSMAYYNNILYLANSSKPLLTVITTGNSLTIGPSYNWYVSRVETDWFGGVWLQNSPTSIVELNSRYTITAINPINDFVIRDTNITIATSGGLRHWNYIQGKVFTYNFSTSAYPVGLARGRADDIWVSMSGANKVYNFANDGTNLGYIITKSGPFAIGFDQFGYLWVSEYNSGTVSCYWPYLNIGGPYPIVSVSVPYLYPYALSVVPTNNSVSGFIFIGSGDMGGTAAISLLRYAYVLNSNNF